MAFKATIRLGLTTTILNDDGLFMPGDGFGFDPAANIAIDPASLPPPSAGPPAVVPVVAQYFLAIDGLNGGSTDEDHVGWFEIDHFIFDLSGAPTSFTLLDVWYLNLTADVAGALRDIALGIEIPSIRIEGVTSSRQAVYDLTLADVSLTELDWSGGGPFSYHLKFDGYDKVGLTTLVQNDFGAFVPGDGFGFDPAANIAIDPASLPPPSAGPPAVVPVVAQYFLAIDGLTGGSTDINHVGWFEINGFSFDLSNAPTSFTPLEVYLNLTPYLVGALSHIARGTQISSISLEGVTSDGHAVYDLTLADVSLTWLWDYGSAAQLSFDGYAKVGLTTMIQNDFGAFVPGDSFGYDLVANTSINPTSLPSPSPGSSPAPPEVAQYFLLIDGLNGGSTDEDHVGWFDLGLYSPFSFEVNNTPASGDAAVFSPLWVDLHLNPDIAGALRNIALGTQITSIRLEGVTSGGQAVYDLTLADVSLAGLVDHLGVHDSLGFHYRKLGLTTMIQNDFGAFVPGDSFGFDLVANTEINPASLSTPSTGSSPGGPSNIAKYFLLIDGHVGNSTDINHVGWFDVGYGFNFQVNRSASAGEPTFLPLSISLEAFPLLVGKHEIPLVRLQGVTADGGVVYDLTLTNSSLTAFGASLTFEEYETVTLVTNVQTNSGLIVPGDSFSLRLRGRGDFDKDGFDDLVIGAPGEGVGTINSAGAINLLYGSAAGLSATGDQYWTQDSAGVLGTSEAGDGFGRALAVGDFDGDGFDDLAAGVAREDVGALVDAGAVNVLQGSAAGLTAAGDQVWMQNSAGVLGTSEAGDRFGATLAVGDFDNDGFDDLAIGASFEAVGAILAAGSVNMLYGSTGGLTAVGNQVWTQDSAGVLGVAAQPDQFGSALAAGDFDGDGFDDLAIGVPGEVVGAVAGAGAVNLLFGSAAGLTAVGDQFWTQYSSGILDAAEQADRFGAVLAAGDFDGDGFDDLAVGVPDEDLTGVVDAGAVNVLHGSAGGLTAMDNQFWTQNTVGILGVAALDDSFGQALAVGDFNRDGFDDLAIGVLNDDVGVVSSGGAVNVLYGSAAGLTSIGDQIWTQNSPGVLGVAEASDQFGRFLSAGDYNGDGFDDLAIGASFEDVGALGNAGAATVLYGSAAGLAAALNQYWTQDSAGVLGTSEAGDWFGGWLG